MVDSLHRGCIVMLKLSNKTFLICDEIKIVYLDVEIPRLTQRPTNVDRSTKHIVVCKI